jgi:hypothetical protein
VPGHDDDSDLVGGGLASLEGERELCHDSRSGPGWGWLHLAAGIAVGGEEALPASSSASFVGSGRAVSTAGGIGASCALLPQWVILLGHVPCRGGCAASRLCLGMDDGRQTRHADVAAGRGGLRGGRDHLRGSGSCPGATPACPRSDSTLRCGGASAGPGWSGCYQEGPGFAWDRGGAGGLGRGRAPRGGDSEASGHSTTPQSSEEPARGAACGCRGRGRVRCHGECGLCHCGFVHLGRHTSWCALWERRYIPWQPVW